MYYPLVELTYPTARHIIHLVMYMLINRVRHDWPEKAGFTISRPNGHLSYTFLHFSTTMEFRLHGKLLHANPGACIFFTPGTPQWFHAKQDLTHNWFHATSGLGPMLEEYNIPTDQLLYPVDTAFISSLVGKLEVEYFSEHSFKEDLIEGYLREFLICFSRSLNGDAGSPVSRRKDHEKVRTVRKQILSTPERGWTIAEMAQLASLSPSRFHAVYKSLFGTSPLQDVIEAKIIYAKSLLLSAKEPTLMEIAEKLGYNDQYHFIRQFKSVTGQTPGAYRRSRQQAFSLDDLTL